MIDEIEKVAKRNPLLSELDHDKIRSIAGYLAGEGSFTDCLQAAADAIAFVRREKRTALAKEVAESLPVRKAVVPSDGGARYFWRVQTDRGCIPAVKDEFKCRGDYAGARRKARELYMDGYVLLELIPPDIDPTNQGDEHTQNRSGHQEPGLTVRQREKKH